MPDGFQVMGGQPQGYAGMLNSAAGSLVRMPDGSLAPFPQMSGPTSLNDIYGFTGFAPANASDPTGPGADWGALTGMLDDPIYSGGSAPYVPANTGYGQPPMSVAQTRSEQARRSPALAAIADAVPQPAGTTLPDKDQSRLLTTLLAFDGDQATGIPASGQTSPVTISVPYPRARPEPPFLSGDPGKTDWTIANQGMQGINGPNDAKYLPNDPRNKPAAKPLPKYAVNTAPGTFNRDTGTWNGGVPAAGNGLPNILSSASGLLGGGGLSLLGRLVGGDDTRQTLIGHLLSGIMGRTGADDVGRGPSASAINAMANGINLVAPNMPGAGTTIQTSQGPQTVGARLNNSPAGYTVTNDPWFNSVRGL